MKKHIFILAVLIICGNSHIVKSEQSIKPVMPQQQLLAKKDALESNVKYAWEQCLKALNEIFPGLTTESYVFTGSISKSEFEKVPSTEENILLIKDTVHSIISKMPKTFMRFDKQTKTIQEQALKLMLERIITSALTELILKDISESLDWCTCIPEYKRITLALLVINEAREKYPNENQRSVYTSLASGSLLQDYVILSELLRSHTNILVNIIDLDYPDVPALAKEDLNIDSPHDLHILEMKNKQERTADIDSFKIKIAQVISTKESSNYNFEVHVYQTAYEYIARVKQSPSEKSNILILTDPSAGAFGTADFPSLANVIQIWEDQEKNPIFTLYVPRHHGVQLYKLTGLLYADEPLTVAPKTMQYLYNQLLPLIVQTGANKNYTPRLVQAFLDRTMLKESVTDEVLAKIGFPHLMEVRANMRKQALKDGYAGNDLLNPLTPIKLANMPVLLSWGSDAHISFQDLVWDALAPNAIVYELYAVDPVKDNVENNKIIKVNIETYKKEDVITPNSGRFSSLNKSDIGEEESIEELPEEQITEPEFIWGEEIGEVNEPEEEHYFVPVGRYERIL